MTCSFQKVIRTLAFRVRENSTIPFLSELFVYIQFDSQLYKL